MERDHVLHPALRPYVASLVGYRARLDPRAVHHGLPSPTITVVLSFDEPLDAGWLGRPAGRGDFWTCASGLHTTPALIRTHGAQHGIQLALTPLGSRALLGLPAGALAGELVRHEDLPLGIGAGLHAELASLDGGERVRRLERHLLTLLARSTTDPAHAIGPELARAWALLQRTGGTVRIDELATRIGWGRRRLTREFRAEYGVSPKQAARVTRFDRSRRLLAAGRPLAELAASAGFFDQAHLSREYAALAGRSPGQLRASAYHLA